MNKKVVLGLILAVALAGITVAWLRVGERGNTRPAPPAAAGGKDAQLDDAITDEGERAAYVASSVILEEVSLGVDPKPGEDAGVVAGVLRVSGKIVNKGAKAIRKVRIVASPKDGSGKVVASYREEVLRGARLGPGESRPFRFVIPANKELSGELDARAE